ncbi:hypothetical protein C100_13945 [Sphingobium sp. C100]|nr:hypothetical protein C100_13945 [Sphingobium sp. C100]
MSPRNFPGANTLIFHRRTRMKDADEKQGADQHEPASKNQDKRDTSGEDTNPLAPPVNVEPGS